MSRLLIVFLFFPFFLSARIVDLEDLEGRRIQVNVISLKEGVLTLRRTDSAALFRIPLSMLSEESQAGLHIAMTESLIPNLRVESISNTRKSTTHWRNSWGEYSKTTDVERVFGIIVSSTSAFRKEVDVFVYWFAGGKFSFTVKRGFVGGSAEIEMVTSEAASENNTRYDYYYGNYQYVTRGDATAELAVLVKDMDGRVLTSWATSRSLEERARKNDDRLTPEQVERLREAQVRRSAQNQP